MDQLSRCSGCGRNTSIWDREKRLHHFQICKRYQNKLEKANASKVNSTASVTPIATTIRKASATASATMTDIIQEFKKQDHQSIRLPFTKSTFVKPRYLPLQSVPYSTSSLSVSESRPVVALRPILHKTERSRTIHPAALPDHIASILVNEKDIHPAAIQPELKILTSQAALAVSTDKEWSSSEEPASLTVPTVPVIRSTGREQYDWSIPPTKWQPELLALLSPSKNVILYPIPDWVILHSPFSEQRVTSVHLFDET